MMTKLNKLAAVLETPKMPGKPASRAVWNLRNIKTQSTSQNNKYKTDGSSGILKRLQDKQKQTKKQLSFADIRAHIKGGTL